MLVALGVAAGVCALVALALAVALAGAKGRERQAVSASEAAVAEATRLQLELDQARLAMADQENTLRAQADTASKADDKARLARAGELAARGAAQAQGEALLELERLKRQRDWAILAGPSLSFAAPAAGMAGPIADLYGGIVVELESIREEVGTAGRVDPPGSAPSLDLGVVGLVARAMSEMLRRLAPGCEELVVSFSGSECLSVGVRALAVRSVDQACATVGTVMAPLENLGVKASCKGHGDSVEATVELPVALGSASLADQGHR